MTRKDYEQVAGAIRRELDESGLLKGEQEYHRMQRLAQRLADMFAFDNPRFDRARFMRACGFDY